MVRRGGVLRIVVGGGICRVKFVVLWFGEGFGFFFEVFGSYR